MAELINCRCVQDERAGIGAPGGTVFLLHSACRVHGQLAYVLFHLGESDVAQVTALATKLRDAASARAEELRAKLAREQEQGPAPEPGWQSEFAQAMQEAGDALKRGVESWTSRMEGWARDRGI